MHSTLNRPSASKPRVSEDFLLGLARRLTMKAIPSIIEENVAKATRTPPELVRVDKVQRRSTTQATPQRAVRLQPAAEQAAPVTLLAEHRRVTRAPLATPQQRVNQIIDRVKVGSKIGKSLMRAITAITRPTTEEGRATLVVERRATRKTSGSPAQSSPLTTARIASTALQARPSSRRLPQVPNPAQAETPAPTKATSAWAVLDAAVLDAALREIQPETSPPTDGTPEMTVLEVTPFAAIDLNDGTNDVLAIAAEPAGIMLESAEALVESREIPVVAHALAVIGEDKSPVAADANDIQGIQDVQSTHVVPKTVGAQKTLAERGILPIVVAKTPQSVSPPEEMGRGVGFVMLGELPGLTEPRPSELIDTLTALSSLGRFSPRPRFLPARPIWDKAGQYTPPPSEERPSGAIASDTPSDTLTDNLSDTPSDDTASDATNALLQEPISDAANDAATTEASPDATVVPPNDDYPSSSVSDSTQPFGTETAHALFAPGGDTDVMEAPRPRFTEGRREAMKLNTSLGDGVQQATETDEEANSMRRALAGLMRLGEDETSEAGVAPQSYQPTEGRGRMAEDRITVHNRRDGRFNEVRVVRKLPQGLGHASREGSSPAPQTSDPLLRLAEDLSDAATHIEDGHEAAGWARLVAQRLRRTLSEIDFRVENVMKSRFAK